MFVLILFGVPGAGKSTIASRLQDEDPHWLVFDTDDFAMSARDQGLSKEDAFSQSFRAFDRFLDRNRNWIGQVCLSASLSSLEKIHSVQTTLSKLETSHVWVKVTCQVEEASQRVRSRVSAQVDDEITEFSIREIERVHALMKQSYFTVANPNGGNLEVVTDEIHEIIHNKA